MMERQFRPTHIQTQASLVLCCCSSFQTCLLQSYRHPHQCLGRALRCCDPRCRGFRRFKQRTSGTLPLHLTKMFLSPSPDKIIVIGDSNSHRRLFFEGYFHVVVGGPVFFFQCRSVTSPLYLTAMFLSASLLSIGIIPAMVGPGTKFGLGVFCLNQP